MTKPWHKTESVGETEVFSEEFWDRHKADIDAGTFWAERIKKLRGEPAERLRVAMENLPLPAAFREAAVATRALIREKKKNKDNYEDEITLLYWLAAINSFSVPYSEKLGEPGFNVLQTIPGKTLMNIRFTYTQLGYERLDLLNKTDAKWLIELWGKPHAHTTLHAMHNSVWSQFEDKLVSKRRAEDARFCKEIKTLLSEPSDLPEIKIWGYKAQANPPANNSQTGIGVLLVALIILAVFVVWLLW